MRSRALIGLAGAAAIVAGGVALGLIRRRRELAGRARRLELPPGPPVQDDEALQAVAHASDEPLVRETRYDEVLDEEAQRRHAAARRLRSDPLDRRLGSEEP